MEKKNKRIHSQSCKKKWKIYSQSFSWKSSNFNKTSESK